MRNPFRRRPVTAQRLALPVRPPVVNPYLIGGTLNPFVAGVFLSDGYEPHDARIVAVGTAWAFLADQHNQLDGILHRQPDGGLTFHGAGFAVRGFAVHDGPAPIRGIGETDRNRTGRWLVHATPEDWRDPESITVRATDDTGPEIVADLTDTRDFRRAQAIRFSADSPGDQLRALGYQTIAQSDDGYFEVLADPRHPRLPMVAAAAGGESCHLVGPGSDLWVWDHTPEPDRRIPRGPVERFRGTVADLRLFHETAKPAELPEPGDGIDHRWAHPLPHFHLGPSNPAAWPMVAPERACRDTDHQNRTSRR